VGFNRGVSWAGQLITSIHLWVAEKSNIHL
jgi:hypothetical protein